MSLNLKQIFGCIEGNHKNAWKIFTDEEKKSVNFWTLNRFLSCPQGSREMQEQAVLKVNEYYNKNYFDISTNKDTGHSELMWQLLCASRSNTNRYSYIKVEKADSQNQKAINLFKKIYPNMKLDEAELLARISTKKELNELAKEHGIYVKF